MEELSILRKHLEKKNYEAALRMVDQLEEMSREDKLNKIYSYAVILLIHLIKQATESRTTTSWELSIRNAIRAIHRTNKRRKAGGYYANKAELESLIREAYEEALDTACVEIFEGKYDSKYLSNQLDESAICLQALSLIVPSSGKTN